MVATAAVSERTILPESKSVAELRPSLHRKLTEVMAAIEWQPKTERNQSQGYAFVSVERIKDAVRDELAKRLVMVYTSIKDVERASFQTAKGSTMLHVTVRGEVTFADAESGEMFTIEAAGEAMDTGDKALNKAQTALVKYALINTFLIPTGDDPDHETAEAPRRAAPRTSRPSPPPADEPPPSSSERPIPESAPKRLVQCESKSPFGTDDAPIQCRREMGHTGAHKTESESWP